MARHDKLSRKGADIKYNWPKTSRVSAPIIPLKVLYNEN
jgi:hypothetical protein